MNPPDPNPPADLRATAADLAARIETVMREDLSTVLSGCDPLLVEVLHHALFNGGKRIRPLLVILSSRCCGREDTGLLRLATAFEYLHVATLIHDDVIDQADKRRGVPTIAAQFGLAAAILTGDWLHARSMHLIGQLTGTEGLEIFCAATASMVNGEFEQLRQAGDPSTTQAQYFSIIRQKTGNLIASACALGALYAGADSAQREALTIYGDRIGAAFQVVDDLLDYQGDAKSTGKRTGNDFLEGKMTLPLLHALGQASTEDQQRLTGLLTGDRTRPGAYTQAHAFIEEHDGFTTSALAARQLIAEAVSALNIFPPTGPAGQSSALLQALAGYILTRTK